MQTPRDKAHTGLLLLKESIFEFLRQHEDWVSHSKVVAEPGLESDFEGSHRNYLSWSMLGLLVNEGRVTYKKQGIVKFTTLNAYNNDLVFQRGDLCFLYMTKNQK